MSKAKIPAAVHFHNTGELLSIDYNWIHILRTCQQALTQDKPYVILPVEERQSSKHNKLRLVKADKDSPLGLVLKTDREALKKYYPYAAIRVNAEELSKYAFKKFNELDEQAINEMINELNE